MSFLASRSAAGAAKVGRFGRRASDSLVLQLSASTLRTYASRKRHGATVDYSRPPRDNSGKIDVSKLVPGSKMKMNPPEQALFESTEVEIKQILELCKRDLKELEFRASGRVTPELLSPVRVQVLGKKPCRLEELATVGVRDGTTLVITVFDESVG